MRRISITGAVNNILNHAYERGYISDYEYAERMIANSRTAISQASNDNEGDETPITRKGTLSNPTFDE